MVPLLCVRPTLTLEVTSKRFTLRIIMICRYREAINSDPEDARAWNLLAGVKDDDILDRLISTLSLQLFDAHERCG
jgi:hypothetical protein